MDVLGIVPARAGSTRVPGKNLRVLGGRPLVGWAIDAARGATRIDHLVVSSDDEEVLAIAAAVDPTLPLRRPAELATAESPAIDYVRHALEVAEAGGARYDAVAIVQPTSPFTRPAVIDEAVALLEATGADSAVTVVQVPHDLHPMKFKTLDGDRLRPYRVDEAGRTRADQLPPVYTRNGSVYVAARATIERGDLLGDDSRAVVMPRDESIDINDEVDLALAELLLARRT
jgi:CMP-N-acetylneuraminic acid synthetase